MALAATQQEVSDSVKLILKDLPLHEVSNEEVLLELKKHVSVLSEVKYSNVYIDGKRTHLRNGDRFLYVGLDQVPLLPEFLSVKEFRSRIVKPVRLQEC